MSPLQKVYCPTERVTNFPMQKPNTVIHADWSKFHQKRWLIRADLRPDGTYHIGFPQPAKYLSELIVQITHDQRDNRGPILFGLDMPFGLPRAYAERRGIVDFIDWLTNLSPTDPFFEVAVRSAEISLARPFYPAKPGGTRRQHLLDGLGMAEPEQLLRRCDVLTNAAPLFWTMGAQQVGKGAIVGWRDFVAPNLREQRYPTAVWPFQGRLTELIATHRIIFAEAYPAEFYHHLGVQFSPQKGRKWGKRIQADRQGNTAVLLDWLNRFPVTLDPATRYLLETGFGPHPNGEDKFDAFVGLLGLLNLVLGGRALHEPTDPTIRQVEGWIIGLENE